MREPPLAGWAGAGAGVGGWGSPRGGLTSSVIEAEVHAVVHDHQGAPRVPLGIVGGLAVPHQRQGVLQHVVLDG